MAVRKWLLEDVEDVAVQPKHSLPGGEEDRDQTTQILVKSEV